MASVGAVFSEMKLSVVPSNWRHSSGELEAAFGDPTRRSRAASARAPRVPGVCSASRRVSLPCWASCPVSPRIMHPRGRGRCRDTPHAGRSRAAEAGTKCSTERIARRGGGGARRRPPEPSHGRRTRAHSALRARSRSTWRPGEANRDRHRQARQSSSPWCDGTVPTDPSAPSSPPPCVPRSRQLRERRAIRAYFEKAHGTSRSYRGCGRSISATAALGRRPRPAVERG